MKNKSVFITGGAGYVGSRLVPILINEGYKVTVYDIMYFGNKFLPKSKQLNLIKGDIRDTAKLEKACLSHDIFINLACISNDSSFELDEKLSTSINLTAFEPMVLAAKKSGVRRFIYASTSSVYGVSKLKDVKEEHPLVPLTLYNKYKGMCEPNLLCICKISGFRFLEYATAITWSSGVFFSHWIFFSFLSENSKLKSFPYE